MLVLKNTITGHSGAIYDTIVDGTFVYTTSADKFVTRWNIDSGEQDKFAIKLPKSGYRICKIGEKHLAIGCSDGAIYIFDIEARKEVKLLTQHRVGIFSLAYNEHSGEWYSADADGLFCVWDGDNFDLKLTLPLVCGKIRSIAINDIGSLISLSCQDGEVRILETKFYNEIVNLKAHSTGANVSIFSEQDDILVSGGKNAKLSKWNWQTEKIQNDIPAHNFAIYDIISLNDGKNLVTCSFDKTVKLWDQNFKPLQRIEAKHKGHSHAVNRLAKINETQFVSVGDDKRIKIWELEA